MVKDTLSERSIEFEVSPSTDGKYVVTRMHVIANLAITRGVVEQSLNEARSLGVSRFLFDVRESPNKLGMVDLLRFIRDEVKTLGALQGMVAAFLIKEDDTSFFFVETAARSAGFIVRLFTEEGEACEWLEGNHQD